MSDTKLCNGPCNKVKPYWAYYQRPDTHDGRVGQCKTCMRAAAQARREADPTKSKDREAMYRAHRRGRNTMNRVRRLLDDAPLSLVAK